MQHDRLYYFNLQSAVGLYKGIYMYSVEFTFDNEAFPVVIYDGRRGALRVAQQPVNEYYQARTALDDLPQHS